MVHLHRECRRRARVQLELEVSTTSRKEFYVVMVGRKPGIYISWVDCQAQVEGFPGARYRGADSFEAAKALLEKGGSKANANAARPSASVDGMASEVLSAVPGGVAPGSIQRRGLLDEKLGPARLKLLTDCIEGKCGHVAGHATLAGLCEPATACRGGCGRALHMLTCAQVGKGYAALGRFTCHHCIAAQTTESGMVSPELLEVSLKTMVLDMTQGAEATAASYAEFARLEQEYASSMGMAVTGGRLMMPHSSVMAFKNFLTWFVIDSSRALSLRSMLLGAEAMMSKLGLVNVAKDSSVKAHVKMLESNHGLESTPSTTGTAMMAANIVEHQVPRRFPKSWFLQKRWNVQTLSESLGGLRVGEAASGGDFHGLLANNTCIIVNAHATEAWARETVELRLEHSKTGHPRYINIAGTTVVSKLEMAKELRQYWHAAGIATTMSTEGALRIERPDFWGVKVTLLGLLDTDVISLMEWLSQPERSEGVRKHAKHSARYVRDRAKAVGVASQAKKHVMIAGGRARSEEVRAALVEAKAWAVARMKGRLTAAEAESLVAVAPAPLLLSTQHMLMGVAPGSTADTMKELMTLSCDAVGEHDPHLSLQLRQSAKWTNHSWRRCADTTARRTKDMTEFGREAVTTQEIDLYFGWHEMELTQDMQIHYSTLSLAERIRQARITCMT